MASRPRPGLRLRQATARGRGRQAERRSKRVGGLRGAWRAPIGPGGRPASPRRSLAGGPPNRNAEMERRHGERAGEEERSAHALLRIGSYAPSPDFPSFKAAS